MASLLGKRPDLIYSDSDHCVSLLGNVIISFSLQPPNPSYLKAWTKAMDHLVESTSGPIAIATIIDSRSRPPDETSKRAIRATVSKHAARTCAFVYVVEGQGFAAAAMRSALSLISLTARYPFPQKVFANVPAGTAWLFQRMESVAVTSATSREIGSTVETMRSRVKHLATAV